MAKQWAATTDGEDVWAIDVATGVRRIFVRTETWPVTAVSVSGDDVVISYGNGRVRIWNPYSGMTRILL
jgi:hypothetical protein